MRILGIAFAVAALSVALFAPPAFAAETNMGVIERWKPFVIVTLVPLLVQGVKLYVVPKIPGWLLPVLAGALGPALDQVAVALSGAPGSPALAVAYGLGGVGVRELLNQIGKAAGGVDRKAP